MFYILLKFTVHRSFFYEICIFTKMFDNMIQSLGIEISIAYTSLLTRANQTLDTVLNQIQIQEVNMDTDTDTGGKHTWIQIQIQEVNMDTDTDTGGKHGYRYR